MLRYTSESENRAVKAGFVDNRKYPIAHKNSFQSLDMLEDIGFYLFDNIDKQKLFCYIYILTTGRVIGINSIISFNVIFCNQFGEVFVEVQCNVVEHTQKYCEEILKRLIENKFLAQTINDRKDTESAFRELFKLIKLMKGFYNVVFIDSARKSEVQWLRYYFDYYALTRDMLVKLSIPKDVFDYVVTDPNTMTYNPTNDCYLHFHTKTIRDEAHWHLNAFLKKIQEHRERSADVSKSKSFCQSFDII